MISRKGNNSLIIIVERISAVGTENITLLTPKPSPPFRARVSVRYYKPMFKEKYEP